MVLDGSHESKYLLLKLTEPICTLSIYTGNNTYYWFITSIVESATATFSKLIITSAKHRTVKVTRSLSRVQIETFVLCKSGCYICKACKHGILYVLG